MNVRLLLYFKENSRGARHQKGKISLYGAHVRPLEKQQKPFCFQINTKDRVYLLSAKSDDDRRAWMEVLEKQIRDICLFVDSIAVDES